MESIKIKIVLADLITFSDEGQIKSTTCNLKA